MTPVSYQSWLLLALLSSSPAYRTEAPTSRDEWRQLLTSFSADQVALLEKINRVDRRNFWRLAQIQIPTDFSLDELAHSPLPATREDLASHPKHLIVDLDSQTFGAYESGRLVRWGPVSSGHRKTPTPPGLYHLNWRAKRHVSTSDPKWILHWYFNFENNEGRAFHAYEMPGYPASHSCIRLLPRDAEWLYHWGVGWQLSPNGRDVLTPGTPVRIESVQ